MDVCKARPLVYRSDFGPDALPAIIYDTHGCQQQLNARLLCERTVPSPMSYRQVLLV